MPMAIQVITMLPAKGTAKIWKAASEAQHTPPRTGRKGMRREAERYSTRSVATCTMAKEMRKMRLDAAPAAGTSPTARTITATTVPVTTTAVAGVPLDPRMRASRRGRVRSRAMANATRDAPRRLA